MQRRHRFEHLRQHIQRVPHGKVLAFGARGSSCGGVGVECCAHVHAEKVFEGGDDNLAAFGGGRVGTGGVCELSDCAVGTDCCDGIVKCSP